MSEPPISPTTSWKELGHPEDSHQPQPQPQPKVDSSSDLEAQSIEDKDDSGQSTLASNNSHLPFFRDLNRKLSKLHVESTGIVPIPLQSRNDKKWWSVGLLWFSANTNVLSFSTGALASTFGLDMKGALLTILFFCMLCSLAPAYFCTFGPKLGMRQMVHTRFSWGFGGASLIALLNCATMLGFTILNAILGGQLISAVSPNASLSPTVGIVIMAVVSLVIAFAGIKIVHIVERWLFVPVLVAFIVLLAVAGTGSEGLHVNRDLPESTARGVLGLGSVIAGFLISWAGLASDVSLYLSPATSSLSLFFAVYFGFFLSSCPLMMVGAAFSISAQDIPAWSSAYDSSIGELFDLILSGPGGVGGFGKFITVILGLSIIGNIIPTMYCWSCSILVFFPPLNRIPRFIFPIVATAIYLPLAIIGASRFYDTLTNFTAVLGYWAALFIGVVMADHVIIRERKWESYDESSWNDWKRLPLGLAAIGSAVLSLGLLVPSIDQIWFIGPIAEHSGDLGFELGLIISSLLYVPLRLLEKRYIR